VQCCPTGGLQHLDLTTSAKEPSAVLSPTSDEIPRTGARQDSQHTKARPFSAPSKRSLIPPAKTPLSPNQRVASQRSPPTARARLALRLGIRVLRAVFFLLRAPRSPTSRNSDASEA
jgi:hypothetical protein